MTDVEPENIENIPRQIMSIPNVVLATNGFGGSPSFERFLPPDTYELTLRGHEGIVGRTFLPANGMGPGGTWWIVQDLVRAFHTVDPIRGIGVYINNMWYSLDFKFKYSGKKPGTGV